MITLWIHMFRMPLFMFLAGYFARMSLQHRGLRDFVRDRWKRIGLVFVVFAPLMLAAVAAVSIWAGIRAGVTEPPAPPPGVPMILLILSPGHLWFLWTLLQLYAIVLLARQVVRGRAWGDRFSERVGDLLTRPGGVVVAALPYFAAIELTHRAIGGPVTIVPELPSTIAYLGAFLTGWFCWGRSEALPRLAKQWPVHLALAVVATVAVVVGLGATINQEATIDRWWARAAVRGPLGVGADHAPWGP